MKNYQTDVAWTMTQSKNSTVWMDYDNRVWIDEYNESGTRIKQTELTGYDRDKLIRSLGFNPKHFNIAE